MWSRDVCGACIVGRQGGEGNSVGGRWEGGERGRDWVLMLAEEEVVREKGEGAREAGVEFNVGQETGRD